MESLRVYELARFLDVMSQKVVVELNSLGINVTSPHSSLKSDNLQQALLHFHSLNNGSLPAPLLDLMKSPANPTKKTAPRPVPSSAFRVNPDNLTNFLERAKNNDILALEPGDYKGPFLLNRPLTLIGQGSETVIFSISEPAIRVTSPGVRLEYLRLERNNGGAEGSVVLDSAPKCMPVLSEVNLLGSAPRAQVVDASWDVPEKLDLGKIFAGFSHPQEISVKVADECRITTTLSSLSFTPSYLAPGGATIRITVDGSMALPGSRLLAGLNLVSTAGVSRSISITAEYVSPPSTAPRKATVQNSKVDSASWGVIFEPRTAQRMLKNAGVPVDQRIDYRNDATMYLQALQEGGHTLWYLRRRGPGQKFNQQKWELTLASDNPASPLAKSLVDKNVTLKLTGAVDGEGYDSHLFIFDASFIDIRRGSADSFSFPLQVRFEPFYPNRICLPDAVVEKINDVPDCSDHIPTADQLAIWESYIAIERKIAEARQFCVPYTRHNFDSKAPLVSFKIDADLATISTSDPDSINIEEFWTRAMKAKNDFIKLVDDDPYDDRRDTGYVLGRIERVDRSGGLLRIRLEDDVFSAIENGRMEIPRYGTLLFDAFGNIIEVKRKERSLQDLREGKTSNPFLGSFFFDSRQARVPETVPSVHKWLDPDRVNLEQRQAVEKVMAAQDLALIWGPPGTGKTTVIAEICYQVAQQGGRTLIASQTNLAVDNAMSRLVHDPSIRALRKGKADKVDDEGRQYTEKHVIGTWLKKTSEHCRKNLSQRQEKVEIFRQLLADQGRLVRYLQQEEQHWQLQAGLRERLESLAKEKKVLVRGIDADSKALSSVQETSSGLGALVRSEGNYSAPESIAVQNMIMPLIGDKPPVIDWMEKLERLIGTLTRYGLAVNDQPILAKFSSLKSFALARRDEISSTISMIELAGDKIAIVKKHLERKQGCEEALHTARVEQKVARKNKKTTEDICNKLQKRLASEQDTLAYLSLASESGNAFDWLSPDARDFLQGVASYLEESEFFTEFRSNLNQARTIMDRLGLSLPDMSPMGQAAVCVRLLSECKAEFGDLVVRGEKLVSISASAQRIIDESQDQRLKKIECESAIRSNQAELEELAKSAEKLKRNRDLIREARQDFPGWIADVRGILSLKLSAGISVDSRFSLDIFPAFPPALCELIDQVGRNKVPWIMYCDQLVAALNQAAERMRNRAEAVRRARDIRIILDEGASIVGMQAMSVTDSRQSLDGVADDFDAIRNQANKLLSRIKEPLGFFTAIFGKTKRRTAEYAELMSLTKRVEAWLAQVPAAVSPGELQQTTETMLATLARQGEEWLVRGIKNFETKVADNAKRLTDADHKLRTNQSAIRSIEKDLAATEGELHSFVTQFMKLTEGLHQLGLVVDSPSFGGRDFLDEMFTYVSYVSGRVKRWRSEVDELLTYANKIEPVNLLHTLREDVQSRLGRLTDQLTHASVELISANSLMEAAESAVVTAGKLCDVEQDKWENNELRILQDIEPFNSLPKKSPLAKIIRSIIITEDDVTSMAKSLGALKSSLQEAGTDIDDVLNTLNGLNVKSIISVADSTLQTQKVELTRRIDDKNARLISTIDPEINGIEAEIERQDLDLKSERDWWNSTWESIPTRLRQQIVTENIHDPAFLKYLIGSFPAWISELKAEEDYLKRYESLVRDWIERLGDSSDNSVSDLRSIYLANANVIGITCSQAASPKFSGEFPEFDVVIIDEVSKCTPPELMMPALKGKKLVLVGDHRQLPPMIDDKTIEDLATDAGIAVSELSFLKTSMFNMLYMDADEHIKQDLKTQYRMHPSIMGVINQFYLNQLKCGINDPDKVRTHGLEGSAIKNNQHVIWVNTPLTTEFREQEEGTSFFNQKEIDTIKEICRQMNKAWAPKVAAGEAKKEIAIITFYLPQLRKIREQIVDKAHEYQNLNIRTGTVDRFQGMERPVVIVSLVRNNAKGTVGFAKSPERVNVAFSRAKELLVIVGSRELFVNNAPADARKIYQEVSDEVRRHGGLKDVSDFCR